MAALFSPRSNFVARVSIACVIGLVGISGLVGFGWDRSSYSTNEGLVVSQPVPFSHNHHAGSLGIDCRYCHTAVESSGYAGVPPTSTCMNCHQQIWTEADLLKPVRESWQTDKPIHWQRVNRLPDFVYFNHSIHVNKGIGCSECHGRVDKMPLSFAASPMTMQWCIDCHRDPSKHLRPIDQITSMTFEQPADPAVREAQQKSLFDSYHLHPVNLLDCSTCHR